MDATSSPANFYTIGIICALPLERTAVESVLDTENKSRAVQPGDNNDYTYGTIGPHNVVVASLEAGDYGTVSASGVANDIRRSFPSVKFGFMVGIAGGMPRPDADDGDVRLGDVVVGCARGVPSIINYRFGKETPEGFDIRSELAEPPPAIQKAISGLRSQHQRQGPTYLKHLADIFVKYPRFNRPKLPMDYFNQPDAEDILFSVGHTQPAGSENRSTSDHQGVNIVSRKDRLMRDLPEGMQAARFIKQHDDGADYPAVHYGTIASADTLMKDGTERDATYDLVKKQRKADILCFEMEASGIVKGWPCLVIRGICDYSDSHKNKVWQNFAAATAAAYAKDLILRLAPEAVKDAPRATDVIDEGRESHHTAGSNFTNSGTGTQRNYVQSGGKGNRQFNADNMTFGRGSDSY